MTNQIRNDPFQPWDQNAHARDLEKTDQFNRLVHEHEVNPGGLRSRLEQLPGVQAAGVTTMLPALKYCPRSTRRGDGSRRISRRRSRLRSSTATTSSTT